MLKSYKTVLLDWDGNLAQTLNIWLEACRDVLISREHHLSDEEIGSSFGAFTDLAESLGIPDYHLVMQEADEIASKRLPYVELYPDALEVLEYLHTISKPMALITSSGDSHISEILERYNLKKFFETIVTGDDVTHRKPHPESIDRALQILNGDKGSTVLIGDSDKDLGAANNAGIDSILFYPPEHRKFYDIDKLTLLNPTYVVEDFTEIKKIVI